MKRSVLKIFLILIIATSLTVGFASLSISAKKSDPGKKMALVNGVAIYEDDFKREMAITQRQLRSKGKSVSFDQIGKIRESVLENLINRELTYQDSQQKKYKVPAEVLNKSLKTLKARFENEGKFKKEVGKMNLTVAEFTRQVERSLTIKRYMDTIFKDKTNISDAQVQEFYAKNPKLFVQPGQVRASHILIKVSKTATKAEKKKARKKIDKIRKRVLKGEDFNLLASKVSEGPSKTKGGDLGFFKKGQMVKPFEDAAFTLKVGGVSEVVETQFGFHIIKVTDNKPETKILLEKVKGQIKSYLQQQKVSKEIQLYTHKLKSKAKIERYLDQKK